MSWKNILRNANARLTRVLNPDDELLVVGKDNDVPKRISLENFKKEVIPASDGGKAEMELKSATFQVDKAMFDTITTETWLTLATKEELGCEEDEVPLYDSVVFRTNGITGLNDLDFRFGAAFDLKTGGNYWVAGRTRIQKASTEIISLLDAQVINDGRAVLYFDGEPVVNEEALLTLTYYYYIIKKPTV
jgi:hypothetical protein